MTSDKPIKTERGKLALPLPALSRVEITASYTRTESNRRTPAGTSTCKLKYPSWYLLFLAFLLVYVAVFLCSTGWQLVLPLKWYDKSICQETCHIFFCTMILLTETFFGNRKIRLESLWQESCHIVFF
jgi:hypothetical protein